MGLSARRFQQQRLKFLERFERFLECAAEQIRFSAMPAAQLLQELATMSEFTEFSLLQAVAGKKDFRTAWQLALDRSGKKIGLSAEEQDLLADFMNGFGKTDVVGEVRYCEQYRLLVNKRLETVREEVRSRGRLYVTLGFCGGGMAGLLLL